MPDKRPALVPTKPSVPVAALPVWWAPTLVGGLMVYLYLFYRTNDKRPQVLPYIAAPDVLVSSWVGHDWTRFAPWDHLLVLLPAALILAMAGMTGRLVLDALHLAEFLGRLERMVYSTAVGLQFWSLFALTLGLAGQLRNRWLFASAATAVLAAAGWRLPRWRETRPPPLIDSPDAAAGWLQPLCWMLSAGLAWLIVWGGTMPATHFDVREYHLQVPKEWFLQGRVTFLPHNVYGNMPMGAEMQALLGMVLMPGPDGWWWGCLVGKTVIAAMAPLTALGIYACGRRLASATAGAVAAFVYLSTPWVAHVSTNGLIDGASALYMLLAVDAVLRGTVSNNDTAGSAAADSHSSERGFVALSGWLAGAGVSCKYPAAAFLAVPLLVYVAVLRQRRVAPRDAAVFALAVVLSCGLWFGKNAVLAGNPTYPLLYRWLGGHSWNAERDARWTTAHSPPRDGDNRSFTPRQLWDSVRLVGLTSDFLGPALWPLAVLAWGIRRCRPSILVWLGFMLWTAAVWWLATHRLDRFLVPLLPFAALLAGFGAVSVLGNHLRWLVLALLVWAGVTAVTMCGTRLSTDDRFLVSLRELRTDVPTEVDGEMTRMHTAHRYLNTAVLTGYRVLLVGEAQVFDLEVPILYNTCFDECIFERLMRDKSREQRLAVLRDARISHIYFFGRELDRYRSPGNYGYSEYPTRELVRDEMARQQQLLRRVPLDLDPDNGEVYEVVGWEQWEPRAGGRSP